MVRNEWRLFTTEHEDMKQKTTKRRSLEDCVVVAKKETFVCFHQKNYLKSFILIGIENILDSIPVSGPYPYVIYLLYISVNHHEKVSS